MMMPSQIHGIWDVFPHLSTCFSSLSFWDCSTLSRKIIEAVVCQKAEAWLGCNKKATTTTSYIWYIVVEES